MDVIIIIIFVMSYKVTMIIILHHQPFLFVANQKAICSPKWLSSHIVELEQQWSTTLSCKNELKKKIAAERARAKTCTRTESGLAKKSKRLKRQIQDDYERVQSAIEEAANARYRAHSAEQRQAEARRHMVDLELMVRGIKGRVTRLEQQLRNRGRQGGNMTQNSKQQFWAIGRKEIVLTDEELGRGSWAMVCIARFRGLSVAAKCLLGKNNKSDLFSREMSIIAKLRHPNLVQFIGATVEGEPIILTELMAGSVRSMLEREPLSPDQITSVSLDVARALLYLHQAQPEPIIHRDVSSANVLLNPGPANSWLAKLADFGSANYLRRVSTRDPGNPSYAAPEAAVPEQHTTKMDVYSYGVLLLEMWSWKIPEKSERRALVQGLEQREVRESIQHCLEPSPSQRPAMSDIILVLQ